MGGPSGTTAIHVRRFEVEPVVPTGTHHSNRGAARCEFCGTSLEDPMLAFLQHLEESADCRYLWEEWKRNVRREAGGT